MNELTQTAAALTLEQCDDMFLKGVLLIKDAVFGYAKLGLTGTEIGKRVRALGSDLSDRSARRYIQQFKAQGLLEEKAPSRATEYRRKATVSNGQNGQMRQPTPTTIPTDDYPNPPAPTPEQQRLQADDWDDATVVTAEVVTMPDGELDFQRAQQLFDELIRLSKTNFANGWTQLQWNTLGGYCRTLEECCNARGGRVSSALKQPVSNGAAFSLGAN